MTPIGKALLLHAIVDAHDQVREATRRRHRALNERAPWSTKVELRKAESLAVAELNLWLDAAANHLNDRAHFPDPCPLCEHDDSHGVNPDVVHPDDGNK